MATTANASSTAFSNATAAIFKAAWASAARQLPAANATVSVKHTVSRRSLFQNGAKNRDLRWALYPSRGTGCKTRLGSRWHYLNPSRFVVDFAQARPRAAGCGCQCALGSALGTRARGSAVGATEGTELHGAH